MVNNVLDYLINSVHDRRYPFSEYHYYNHQPNVSSIWVTLNLIEREELFINRHGFLENKQR